MRPPFIQYFRKWACSYNAWVTCLDDQQQPSPGPHPCDPTFVMVNRNSPNDFWYIPEYYLLGQFSRFVKRGAYRVASTYGSLETVTNVAFVNPDGKLVLVVVNQTNQPQAFTLAFPDAQFNTTLPEKTAATFVKNP